MTGCPHGAIFSLRYQGRARWQRLFPFAVRKGETSQNLLKFFWFCFPQRQTGAGVPALAPSRQVRLQTCPAAVAASLRSAGSEAHLVWLAAGLLVESGRLPHF